MSHVILGQILHFLLSDPDCSTPCGQVERLTSISPDQEQKGLYSLSPEYRQQPPHRGCSFPSTQKKNIPLLADMSIECKKTVTKATSLLCGKVLEWGRKMIEDSG